MDLADGLAVEGRWPDGTACNMHAASRHGSREMIVQMNNITRESLVFRCDSSDCMLFTQMNKFFFKLIDLNFEKLIHLSKLKRFRHTPNGLSSSPLIYVRTHESVVHTYRSFRPRERKMIAWWLLQRWGIFEKWAGMDKQKRYLVNNE
jgi:hypothetical protein